VANKISDNIYENDEADYHQGSFQFAIAAFVEATFSKGNHLAEAYDGMRQPGRVTQHKVEQPTNQQG
jgi:hypothetical protein